MFGYQLSEGARRALARARHEAALRCQDAVQTEHLALAIVGDDRGPTGQLLSCLRVDTDALARRLDATAPRTEREGPCLPDLPYAHEALKAVELAMREARAVEAETLEPEHLLLGVLGERSGLGGRILSDAGLTVDAARAMLTRREPASAR